MSASRADFFASADVVTLHQRLVAATHGNVDADDLARMKPDALLVNTSRAERIAPGALAAALDAGRPGFAALDVYNPSHPWLQRSNVLCTPHPGYVEHGSYQHYLGIAFDNALRFFGGDHRHVVNPALSD